MAKVFISHSTVDKEIVEAFKALLQMGMGIARDDIFCTSYENTLPTGEEFIPKIKEELVDCEAVVFLITDNYLKSQFCLAELGAAWGLGKRIYPLLLVEIEKIERTPLKGIQVLFLNREGDMFNLYDEFCSNGIIARRRTAECTNQMSKYMRKINVLAKGDFLLQPDADGYYTTEISAIRQVPPEFKCYKIKGHIAEWNGCDDAKTDWLFYRTGIYESLDLGDKVRFKVSKTDVNEWKDIGKAKNIYPADLEKLKEE